MTETKAEETKRLEEEAEARKKNAEATMKAEEKLPTKAQADKIMEQRIEEAKKTNEKLAKEQEVERNKQAKLDSDEADRRAKIQKMSDGEAGSVPASKKVERYNTEDGLPPRYVGGNLEPENAKK